MSTATAEHGAPNTAHRAVAHHRRVLRRLVDAARAPRRRAIADFAEEEIVLKSGPAPGRFRVDRQPFARLFFAEIESGHWTSFNIVGCVQSGKTIIGFVIPTLYFLFEYAEAVICGVPHERIAASKWLEILRPAIAATRYLADLPTTGEGSKGSAVESVYFRNAASLKFMTGGGGDAARASETARVVVITETSKMDVRGESSDLANKVSQLIARTKSFDARARVFMESTPTVEDGLAWQNHLQGSQSKICLPCPHCGQWIVPTDSPKDRELLTGWREAKDEIEAEEKGAFACWHCGAVWTEEQRREANLRAVLIHKGQRIERISDLISQSEKTTADTAVAPEPRVPIDGTEYEIVGERPRTRVLGFRWSAINNLLRTAGSMAAEEWRAARAVQEDDAQRAIAQDLWGLPYKSALLGEFAPLKASELQKRMSDLRRGVLPAGTKVLTVGVDVQKWRLYYVVKAWWGAVKGGPAGEGHTIVDYGCVGVPTGELGILAATLTALRELRDTLAKGLGLEVGGTMRPQAVWIDTNYAESRQAVLQFCRESAREEPGVFMPLLGRGSNNGRRYYTRPNKEGKAVAWYGEDYHLVWTPAEGLHIVEVNVDHWKSWLHDRLAMPAHTDGAVTLFHAPSVEHLTFTKHLSAEVREPRLVEGKGMVFVWRTISTGNHFLDAGVYACSAGHFSAMRMARQAEWANFDAGSGEPLTLPDGRPFFVTER